MRRIAPLLVVPLLLVAAGRGNAQSREQIDRLAALGQVWGFLKYYHPGVAAVTSTINWDSVLVATVPNVKTARTTGDFNATIQSLLDAAGSVRPCAEWFDATGAGPIRCQNAFPDSMRINLDLGWLTDSKLLSPDIRRQLANVRDNRHRGSGRYVYFRLTAMLDRDTAFATPEYPSEGGRLLSLFRFWNAARYYFPYLYVNDGNWNAVLPEFIPRMIGAKDALEYHLIALEMMARINDAHVGGSSALLSRALGSRFPAFEARSIGGQLVVTKPAGAPSDGSGLQVGDVITDIEGTPVSQRRRDLTKYVAAGNPAVFERKLISTMLRARDDSATYTIERDGRLLTRRVPMARGTPGLPSYPITDLVRVLPNTNIGYINMGDLNLAQVDSAIAIVKNTDGLVMDVRNYPRGTMYKFAEFLNPGARPFVKFTSVDSTFPGQVVWRAFNPAGRPGGNADHYRGRVAILVDERTQSHAEFTAMALRTAPENRVIGSQTAGADGNVTMFQLPGGIRTLFTGLGVYYPDGTPTQRIGIVPDIEVRPTLAGIRAGRDEVLERALQYVRTGR